MCDERVGDDEGASRDTGAGAGFIGGWAEAVTGGFDDAEDEVEDLVGPVGIDAWEDGPGANIASSGVVER